MRNRTSACALYLSLIAVPAFAQAPPSPSADTALVPPPDWAFNDIACAPALAPEKLKNDDLPHLRIVGVQDPSVKQLLGPGDVVVLSAGSNATLQAGQRFYVRRLIPGVQMFGEKPRTTIHTSGWVQVLGVDTTVATATVVHACDGIEADDYLEPFMAPAIAARPLPGSTPQYENMGHIVTGVEGLYTAGQGNVMTIDRGANTGVVVGQRYLVFRDKRTEHIDVTGRSKAFAAVAHNAPLVEIGEVLVVAVRADDATVQVIGSRDAITRGDLIAPIR
jgi:hypothetical protein